MASTVKCEYCGSAITSADKLCPHCGASNPLYVEDTAAIITDPKTIEELQEYCTERGMPLLRMRFFIGENCKEPKAFGIYRESNGEIVVYKNKADGIRAERYRGRDEAFAVGEIYQKLLDECHRRGLYPDGRPADVQRAAQSQKTMHVSGSGSRYGSGKSGNVRASGGTAVKKPAPTTLGDIFGSLGCFGWGVLAILLFVPVLIPAAVLIFGLVKIGKKEWDRRAIRGWVIGLAILSALNFGMARWMIMDMRYQDGYYVHNDTLYYRYDDKWYTPDPETNDWAYVSSTLDYDGIDYTEYVDDDEDYDVEVDDWDTVSFTDSAMYAYLSTVSSSSYSSSSDSGYDSYDSYDYDYDSGSSYDYDTGSSYDSWDSGSTDWDSDW